jgi:hypothetical protein
VAADSQAVTELQDIIARHLVRFAGDDAVQVHWTVAASDAEVDPSF